MTEKNLYNIHEGIAGRDGGPYLDQVEAREAERRRALVEGRDPDYDNLPATAGQPLVTADQLLGLQGTSNIPSQESNRVQAAALDQYADTETFPITPHSARETTETEDAAAQREADRVNPASSTVVSKDSETESEDPASPDVPDFPFTDPNTPNELQ